MAAAGVGMGGKGGVAIGADQNSATPDAAGGPRRHLSLLDAMCLVVGIVIGVMIFKAPSIVAASTAGPGWMLAAWVLGGLFCLAGALTYTELASAYPRVGGEFVYLDRAFGGAVSFLFVWARTTVIQTGSIALAAYVFGDYMVRLVPLGDLVPVGDKGSLVWAVAATVVLTATNVVGLKTGKWTQNVLTAVKVAGVLAIAVVGLAFASSAEVPQAAPAAAGDGPGLAGFGLAMIFVLYTFGGWNEAAYVAGELKDEKRNALRLLVGSIILITVVYVAVNLAYLHVLGFDAMGKTSAVAADAVAKVFGQAGGAAVSVLVAVSALGTMNGCIFTGARSICGLGEDHRLFRALGRWSRRFGTPAAAILVQSAIAVVLILLPGLGWGMRERLGSGFEEAVKYTAPAFWAFFLLTGVALFVLRVKEPQVERPFRVPLYPVTVVVFCGMCAWMLYRSLDYRALGAVVGVIVLLAGVPVYVVARFGWKAFGLFCVRVLVSVVGAGVFYGVWLAVGLLTREAQGPVLRGTWYVVAPVVTALGFAVGAAIGARLTKARPARFLYVLLWPLVGCAVGAAAVYAFGPMLIVFGMFLCGTAAVAVREIVGMGREA